eukprot:TRINITY_DN74888_c0_g1_i1.p1 TRINITY_DN74888_c0_g1~~TRINITY_DN74888_c0_g1_i1.p1  ORF type:complete len:672 (+),score=101.94 TRINITY_DN74888_c0_g1_i1:100-2115(+)
MDGSDVGDQNAAFLRHVVVILDGHHRDLKVQLHDIATRQEDALFEQQRQLDILCKRLVDAELVIPNAMDTHKDVRADIKNGLGRLPDLKQHQQPPPYCYADIPEDDISPSSDGGSELFKSQTFNRDTSENKGRSSQVSAWDSSENDAHVECLARLRVTERKLGTDRTGVYGGILELDTAGHSEEASPPLFERFVKSQTFNAICSIPILVFSVLVGIETDYMARHEARSHHHFATCHMILGTWFAIELVARLFAFRSGFFRGGDVRWNLMDTCMVLTWLLEILVVIVPAYSPAFDFLPPSVMTRTVKAVRMLRLVKMLRIVRMLRCLRDFQKMVYALQACLMTLAWCVILIFCVIYLFSIHFTQGVMDELISLNDQAQMSFHEAGAIEKIAEPLRDAYGTLPRSIISLYFAMSNGLSWESVLRPLMGVHWSYALVFLVYITFVMFGFLNVLTSVFVESTMQSAQHQRELVISDAREKKDTAMDHMRKVFTLMDVDGTGEVDVIELKRSLETNPECVGYLQACDISIDDVDRLFRMLDLDGSGTISISEFLSGCLRLKGEARSFDIHCMMYESNRCIKRWAHFMEDVLNNIDRIFKEFDKVLQDFSAMRSDIVKIAEKAVSNDKALCVSLGSLQVSFQKNSELLEAVSDAVQNINREISNEKQSFGGVELAEI